MHCSLASIVPVAMLAQIDSQESSCNEDVVTCSTELDSVLSRVIQACQQMGALQMHVQIWQQHGPLLIVYVTTPVSTKAGRWRSSVREYSPWLSYLSMKWWSWVPVLPAETSIWCCQLSKCHLMLAGCWSSLAQRRLWNWLRMHSLVGSGMARDVEQYCQECYTCQKSKPPLPQRSPLV